MPILPCAVATSLVLASACLAGSAGAAPAATAFLVVSLAIPAGGILWILGARYLDEDTRRAEGGSAPPTAEHPAGVR